MFTVFDYVKRNKEVSLEKSSWNLIDNLVCSILAYLPTDGFNEERSLQEIYDEVKVVDNPEKLGAVEPKSIELIKLMLDGARYEGLKISNFVKIKNGKTQFGAATFRIKGITIVSFQGTDYSTIGWLEDFRLAYEYPTHTQVLAVDYLKKTLDLEKDNCVYVVGHSKGGTLAMTSVMENSDEIYKRIKRVYNFDGPGFRDEEYHSKKYKKMSKKLTNFVPTGSMIGVLLNNRSYEAVKTNTLGFNGHFPTYWRVYGKSFVRGRLSCLSRKIHKSTMIALRKVDDYVIKEAVEGLFAALSDDVTADIKLSLEKVMEVYKELKEEKPETFECLEVIFKEVIAACMVKGEYV